MNAPDPENRAPQIFFTSFFFEMVRATLALLVAALGRVHKNVGGIRRIEMRVRKTNKRCRVPHMRITNILIDRQTSVKLPAVSARRVLAQLQKDCGAVVDDDMLLVYCRNSRDFELDEYARKTQGPVYVKQKVALSHADVV